MDLGPWWRHCLHVVGEAVAFCMALWLMTSSLITRLAFKQLSSLTLLPSRCLGTRSVRLVWKQPSTAGDMAAPLFPSYSSRFLRQPLLHSLVMFPFHCSFCGPIVRSCVTEHWFQFPLKSEDFEIGTQDPDVCRTRCFLLFD